VTQLLKEAGVDLSTHTCTTALGQPSEVAPEAETTDLVNMPDTIDYEVDKIAWRQGLPPGEGRPQLSGLDLADSDSDSSDNSIPSMCLDGLDRDAWMPDAEEAQDNMQVGEADRAMTLLPFRGARRPGVLGRRMWCLPRRHKGQVNVASCLPQR